MKGLENRKPSQIRHNFSADYVVTYGLRKIKYDESKCGVVKQDDVGWHNLPENNHFPVFVIKENMKFISNDLDMMSWVRDNGDEWICLSKIYLQ